MLTVKYVFESFFIVRIINMSGRIHPALPKLFNKDTGSPLITLFSCFDLKKTDFLILVNPKISKKGEGKCHCLIAGDSNDNILDF
jgi:hypothetical protein